MTNLLKLIQQKSFLAVTTTWDKVLFPNYVANNLRKRDSVAIYPNLGILYNRIKKSGNSTITSFLAENEGEAINTCKEAKQKFQRPDFFNPQSSARTQQLSTGNFRKKSLH